MEYKKGEKKMLIELPFPVVPKSEIETVANILGEEKTNVENVLKYKAYCSTGFNHEFIYSEEHKPNSLTGSRALVRMAELRGVKIPTVQDFNIPDQIFLKRFNLFDLASNLESRLWRIQILSDINAPEVVIRHEEHALCNAVWKILEFPV